MGKNISIRIARKAARMMESGEKEMNLLGRTLFWSYNPTYEDYLQCKSFMKTPDITVYEESFYEQKAELVAKYGAGITKEDSNNAG